MKKITIPLCIVCFCCCAMAADGVLGKYGLGDMKNNNSLGINETTADCLDNFSWEDAFGVNGESRTTLETAYEFNSLYAGKKIANHAAVFAVEDKRGLFGGESYTRLSYLYTTDNAYADIIMVLSGWKYNITEYMHLDIGGDFKFTDKDVYGDYRPATLGGGTKLGGNIYFGFIGDCPEIQPFVYYIYDFSFESSEFRAGINPTYRFGGALSALVADAAIYAAYAYVNDFSCGDFDDARESYWYTIAKMSLTYELCRHFYVKATVGYGYNTSNGVSNMPAYYDCGPRSNAFAGFALGFGF